MIIIIIMISKKVCYWQNEEHKENGADEEAN